MCAKNWKISFCIGRFSWILYSGLLVMQSIEHIIIEEQLYMVMKQFLSSKEPQIHPPDDKEP